MITLLQLRPYTGDRVAPSPNHGARHVPRIQGIVLHATADDGNEALALAWLRSPASRVSCHLMVSRAGRVTRLVGDRQRAWHAGDAWWRGTTDVNSITLGIEIANRNDGEPYTAAQYNRVAAIVAHYCRQGLALDDVVGHEAIAPGRKTDPFGWDWERVRGMVRHQLHADVERGGGVVYDRRGADRVAAEEAALFGATEELTSSAPPQARPLPNGTAPGGSTSDDAASDGGWISTPPSGRERRIARPKRRIALATPKPLLRSRMLWLNAMTVLAAGGMLVGDTLDLAHQVGITVPEVLAKWALFFVGLVNIVLRLRTTRPLTYGTRLTRAAEPYALPDEDERGDDGTVSGVQRAD